VELDRRRLSRGRAKPASSAHPPFFPANPAPPPTIQFPRQVFQSSFNRLPNSEFGVHSYNVHHYVHPRTPTLPMTVNRMPSFKSEIRRRRLPQRSPTLHHPRNPNSSSPLHPAVLLGGSEALLSGHPEFCPSPVPRRHRRFQLGRAPCLNFIRRPRHALEFPHPDTPPPSSPPSRKSATTPPSNPNAAMSRLIPLCSPCPLC